MPRFQSTLGLVHKVRQQKVEFLGPSPCPHIHAMSLNKLYCCRYAFGTFL